MLNIFMTSLKYSFAEKANKTLYNLNKLPFIKKIIGDKFYKETECKNVFGIIGFILSIFIKFIVSLAILTITATLPAYLINEYRGYGPKELILLQILVVTGALPGLFLSSSIFTIDDNDYNMLKLLRVNPKEYYISKVVMDIKNNIIFLPAMLVLGINDALFLTLEAVAIGIIGEYIQIILFDKFNFILSKNKVLNIFLWIFVIIVSYVPCTFGLIYDFRWIVESPIFLIAIMVIAIISFIQIKKYNGYKNIVIKMNLKSAANKNLEELNGDVNFGDVKISNVEGEFLDSSKFNDKRGYEYLNSIFFFRNKRLVRNSVRLKCIFITAAMLILSIVILVTNEDIEEVFSFIKNSSPYLLFFMCIMSSTERLCKAMFFNCDLSLLRYGFYKRKEDILKNFTSRLKKILFYNSIHTFLLVIELSLFVVIIGKGAQFIEVIPILISIISLSCFFTIYGVFMYYIVQPYTKNLEVKSPVFSFCNCIMYGVSYACFKIKTASYIFTLGIIALTLIFIPISILCIYKYAPKTFKLK